MSSFLKSFFTVFLLINLLVINILSANDVIKLRFEEIIIESNPIKKTNTTYSKKIVNFLQNYIIGSESLGKFSIKINVKRYDIKIIKPQEKYLFSFSKNSGDKVSLHELILDIEVKDSAMKVLNLTELKVESFRSFDNIVSLKVRKEVNNEIYSQIEKKLKENLKKYFLIKFGDLLIPN